MCVPLAFVASLRSRIWRRMVQSMTSWSWRGGSTSCTHARAPRPLSPSAPLSVRGTLGRWSTSSLDYLTRIHAALSQTPSSGDFGHSIWGFGDAVPPRICEKVRLFVAFFIPRVINCESLGFRRTRRLRVLFRDGKTEGAAYLNTYRYHLRKSLR